MDIKPYKELTIRDDFVFHHVMSIEHIAGGVVDVVLPSGVNMGAVKVSASEVAIVNGVEVKGVRMDVLIEGTNATCDLEMQNRVAPSIKRRARYYSSAIDTQYLKKGCPYGDLKDNYIVFFFNRSLYKSKLPLYTVQPWCLMDPEADVGDGSLKLFYDYSQWSQVENKELRALLQYIATGEVHSALTRMIDDEVQKLLASAQGEKNYMDTIMTLRQYWREGNRDGIESEKERTARDMLRNSKFTMEDIVELTKLSLSRVEQIRAGMGAQSWIL